MFTLTKSRSPCRKCLRLWLPGKVSLAHLGLYFLGGTQGTPEHVPSQTDQITSTTLAQAVYRGRYSLRQIQEVVCVCLFVYVWVGEPVCVSACVCDQDGAAGQSDSEKDLGRCQHAPMFTPRIHWPNQGDNCLLSHSSC